MAATSVGEIGLDLVINQNQFKQQMHGITGLAKKAGAALAAAFATKKLIEFGSESADHADDAKHDHHEAHLNDVTVIAASDALIHDT